MFILTASPLGYAYALSGRVDVALSLLEQVVEGADRSGFLYDHALYVSWLSESYFLADRKEDAVVLAQRALERSREYKERGHEAYALHLVGNIAAHRDSPESALAETHYQQALTLATELGMRPLQAHCHRGLGKLYSQTGQAEQARAELSTAIAMYRDMEMNFWLPETETALAAVEGR
jgi:tetratricopeptide (TPR) repeat protein